MDKKPEHIASILNDHDGTLEEVIRSADAAREHGATVFQKWRCAKCNSRQTIPDANVFFHFGQCEDCGHVTDLRPACGYMAIFGDDYVQSVVKNALNK